MEREKTAVAGMTEMNPSILVAQDAPMRDPATSPSRTCGLTLASSQTKNPLNSRIIATGSLYTSREK
jgi:hypothetical protein